jgi:hypothetical protein
MPRKLLLAAITVGLSVLATTLVFEAVLRFLPVSTGLKARAVTPDDPLLRFEPNRDIVFSHGWRMARPNRVHVNNAGFVSPVDYDTAGDTPLLAVIGDSYVEALAVPAAGSLTGRLATASAGRGRVYGFAASGAPLSQYLIYAQHARESYAARGAVIVVVGNDFDESVIGYETLPGFYYFDSSRDDWLLTLIPHEPHGLRDLVSYSAFARYLVFNLGVQHVAARWRYGQADQAGPTPAFVGNTSAETTPKRMAESRRAVDRFFDELANRTGWSPADVLFVVDGLRLYDAERRRSAAGSYFVVMREYFLQAANARGYAAIDMDPLFDAAHAADGAVFEWEDDRHWNGLAHRLAAEAVVTDPFFERAFAAR